MSLSGAMRYEISRYRKHRPGAGGPASGLPYQDSRACRRYAAGQTPAAVVGGYPRDSYYGDLPSQYHPSVHAPAVQSHEYRMDPPMPSYPIAHGHEPHLPAPFEPREPPFDHRRARRIDWFLPREAERRYIEQQDLAGTLPLDPLGLDGSEGPPDERADRQADDRLRQFFDQCDALSVLQRTLPPDHPDILNLLAAVTEALADPNLMAPTEPFGWDGSDSKLGGGDPYINDDLPQGPLEASADDDPSATGGLEQIVEEQMAMLQALGDPAAMEACEPAVGFAEQAGAGLEEIEQAIDALRAEPMAPDLFEQGRAIFEEQMHLMDNPLRMGDPMMPDPGPGGGP